MPRSSAQDVSHQALARRPGMSGSAEGVGRQLGWFAGIGVVMTLAYLALYVALAGTLGAQAANVVAWVATAIVDTAANRRLTFGFFGRQGVVRAQIEGLLVFGTGMVLTSGSLFSLDALVTQPAQLMELGVLILANIVAGLLRFHLLRQWVFAPRRLLGPTSDLPTTSLERDRDRDAVGCRALAGAR